MIYQVLPDGIVLLYVESSDGTDTYYPCIETTGRMEVMCSCRKWDYAEAWMANCGFTILMTSVDQHCSHITLSIDVILEAGLL